MTTFKFGYQVRVIAARFFVIKKILMVFPGIDLALVWNTMNLVVLTFTAIFFA
jgi:hypothetical protein